MYRLDGRYFLNDTGGPVDDWLQKYIPPEDQEVVMSAIQHAIQTKSVFQLDHRVLKADGSIGWTSSRAIPIMNRDGAITEWFGVASDITDKKTLLTQLEAIVDERT